MKITKADCIRCNTKRPHRPCKDNNKLKVCIVCNFTSLKKEIIKNEN